MTNQPAKTSPPQQPLSAIHQPGATTSHSRLTPATAKQGNSELLSCLILVAPSGMTAEDRDAWLRAAKMTLSGIPADLLAIGCDKARRSCRFPSEIVPTIIEEIESNWKWRKQMDADRRAQEANRNAPKLEQKAPDYVTPEDAAKILVEFGLKRA